MAFSPSQLRWLCSQQKTSAHLTGTVGCNILRLFMRFLISTSQDHWWNLIQCDDKPKWYCKRVLSDTRFHSAAVALRLGRANTCATEDEYCVPALSLSWASSPQKHQQQVQGLLQFVEAHGPASIARVGLYRGLENKVSVEHRRSWPDLAGQLPQEKERRVSSD